MENDSPVPFVWTGATGMLRLADYLAGQGLDFSELGLSEPWLSAVSDDGLRLAVYEGIVSQAKSFLIHPVATPTVPGLPLLGQLVLLGALVASGVRSLRRS
jgi:hypothetical protein